MPPECWSVECQRTSSASQQTSSLHMFERPLSLSPLDTTIPRLVENSTSQSSSNYTRYPLSHSIRKLLGFYIYGKSCKIGTTARDLLDGPLSDFLDADRVQLMTTLLSKDSKKSVISLVSTPLSINASGPDGVFDSVFSRRVYTTEQVEA